MSHFGYILVFDTEVDNYFGTEYINPRLDRPHKFQRLVFLRL